MTKRFLITLTILFAVILSLASPLFAQGDRRIGDNRTPIERQQEARGLATPRTVQQLRADINALCDEADVTFEFFSRYSIAQDSVQKLGYEDMAEVLKRIAGIRTQMASYSDDFLLTMGDGFPSAEGVGRLKAVLSKVRADVAYQASLSRAEEWFVSEKNRSSVTDPEKAGARSTTSAPAFTRPVCNFYNLVDFPSAVDIGIAKGVLLAIEIIINSLNPSVGNNAPNPAYFIAVIAKGITKAIVLGLDGARDAGLWCQDIAFYIQGAMMTDGLFIDAVLFPPSSGGYMEFLKDFIPAIITKAQEKGVAVNCANDRRVEGDIFYNQGKWADAYKKYRTAYANIGAAGCQTQ
ncbi:MAG: hypothetical protein ACKVZH_22405 [Blastocatellia bacterium]